MWRFTAILLLGLAWWGEPASAYDVKLHELTVSIHQMVHPKLNEDEIVGILKGASDILQGNTDITPHNNCNVAFKFKGFIPFPASLPAEIANETDLEQVHRVPADVKVVQRITYCVDESDPHGIAGCAWRRNGQRTMIVAREKFPPLLGSPQHDRGVGPVIWAHEFGHTTGLNHRYHKGVLNDSENLMTPCQLEVFSQPINKAECTKFRAGPKPPPYSQVSDSCQTNVRRRTD